MTHRRPPTSGRTTPVAGPGDEVLKDCVRKGLDQGVFVYEAGERREGKGLPPGVLNLGKDTKIYMVEKAEELGIWPPPTAAPEPPPTAPALAFTGSGEGHSAIGSVVPQSLGAGAGVSRPGNAVASPPSPPSPGRLERTDNTKTALTQLAEQVTSSGKGIHALTWRMNSGDGFIPLALLKAEPGATVQVKLMETPVSDKVM